MTETTKGRTMNREPGWWVIYVTATLIFITALYWLAHVALWIGRVLGR